MFSTQDLGSHLVKQFTADVQHHALLLESGLVAGEGFVAMIILDMLMLTLMPKMMMTVLMVVLTIHYPQQSARCLCVSGGRETRSTIACGSG
jgi:hypothetical protein